MWVDDAESLESPNPADAPEPTAEPLRPGPLAEDAADASPP